jgi:hypothetical protein
MSSPSREAAETLSSLEALRTRTLADAYRWEWLIWLFWAAAYLASIPVFLAAPDWGIGLYWLCVVPIAIGATVLAFRRLPRREGVVPLEGQNAILGGLGLAAVAFLTGPVSPLGPALAVALAIVVFGWIWPRRLAVMIAAGLAATAIALALALDEREAGAVIAAVYALVFVGYALYERQRLNAMR